MSISRLTFLSLCITAASAAGCGGSSKPAPPPPQQDGGTKLDMPQAQPDLLMSMQPDLLTAPQPDMATPPPPPTCPAGNQCGSGNQRGICQASGQCGCSGASDCSGYAGTICTGGYCVTGGCVDYTTCAGQICDPGTNTCQPCSNNGQCPGSAPYCTANGTCSATAPACTVGTSCNGGTGWCCGAGTPVCGAGPPSGGCCANSDCGTGTCNTTTHVCTPSKCTTAFSGTTYYVNPNAAADMSGVGTAQCPFTELVSAFNALPAKPAAGTKICTEGTFGTTADKYWPRHIPSNVELDGTYCGANTKHTIFNVPPANSAVYMDQAGPAYIHGFDINSGNPTTAKANDGVYVTNTDTTTPVQIYDVNIKGFLYGIHVSEASGDKEGNALIRHDSAIDYDYTGLRVDSGAHASIEVTDASYAGTRAEFDYNDNNGIYCTGATLTIKGEVFTGTTNSRTVRADDNVTAGLYADDNCLIDVGTYFSASNNNGHGVLMSNVGIGGSFANSVFIDNGQSGFKLFSSQGGLTIPAGTGLGTDNAKNAGNNLIKGNGQAGVCIGYHNAAPLMAEGDTWNAAACQSGAAGGAVIFSTSCTDKVDVAGPEAGPNEGNNTQLINVGAPCTKKSN